MAISRIYRFTTSEEVEAFVNGCVVLRTPGPLVTNIVGKSIVFSQPSSKTVTFTADGQGRDLSPQKMYNQIRVGMPTLITRQTSLGVLIMEDDPTQGVEVTSDSDPEVLRAFGLPLTGSKGTVYKPTAISATPPCFIAISGSQGMYEILTYIDGPFVP